MKVYSAYRCNEIPNNRTVKVLEAASLLEVFQQYYDVIQAKCSPETNDEYRLVKEFFGAQIYGASFYRAIFEDGIPRPNSIEELEDLFTRYWYTNEMSIATDCIEIYTDDDDEIDLAWYLFDEPYATTHPEQTLLYTTYTAQLPTATPSTASYIPTTPTVAITPAVRGDGALYMLTVAVYDGDVLGGLGGGGKIEGLRLPRFIDWLIANTPNAEEFNIKEQIQYLAKLAKEGFGANTTFLLQQYTAAPLSDLSQTEQFETILGWSLEKLAAAKKRTNPGKSSIFTSEHIWELWVNAGDFGKTNYYDYMIVFDDIWAANYPELAENLLRFASGISL